MNRLLLYSCLIIFFFSCDVYYNLTPLDCLLYTPLTCNENINGVNVQILKDDKEISSLGSPYSDLQKELVFELQEDGTVHYWFKKDYLKSPIDTINILDGQKSLSHTIYHGSQLYDKLKHIYTTGKWEVNFKDSTLKIDFGENNFNLISLEGKYTRLGAGNLSFQQTYFFDSLVNGKKDTFKKVVNTYFGSF